MTKGTYRMASNVGPSKDGSFRSCICTMLVFLVLCVVLLLVSLPWRNNKPNHKEKDVENISTNKNENKFEKQIAEVDEDIETIMPTTKAPLLHNKTITILNKNNTIITSTTTPVVTTSHTPDITTPIIKSTNNWQNHQTKIIATVTTNPPITTTISTQSNLLSSLYTTDGSTITYSSTDKSTAFIDKKSQFLNNSTSDVTSTESYTTLVTESTTTDKSPLKDLINIPVGTTNNSTESDTTLVTESTTTTTTNKSPLKNTMSTPFGITNNSTRVVTTTESDTTLVTESTTTTTNKSPLKDTMSTPFEITNNSTRVVTTTESATSLITENELPGKDPINKPLETTNNIVTSTESGTTLVTESTIATTNELPLKELSGTGDVTSTETVTTLASKSTTEASEEYFEINETSGTGITEYPDYTKQQKLSTTITKPTTSSSTTRSSVKATTSTSVQPLLSLFKHQQPVCQSSGCKQVATRILSRINHVIDPCEDFYDYACGADNNDNIAADATWRWITEKVHEVTGSSPVSWQIFRKYYDSCLMFHSDFNYEERVAGGKKMFLEVDRMYERTQQIAKETTLTDLLTKLIRQDSSPLFDISLDVDKQSKHFVFQLTLGKRASLLGPKHTMSKAQQKCFRKLKKQFNKRTVDLNNVYERYVTCQSNHSDYLTTVERAVKAFGAFSTLDEYNKTWHLQNILKTIEWDIFAKLEDLPAAGVIHNDLVTKNYKVFKVSELKLQFKLIKWDKLLTELAHKPIDDEQVVQVYFSDYFKHLFTQLESLPTWQVHNAILAMFAHDLYTNLIVPQQTEPIEDFCVHQTANLLKEVTSSMHLTSYPSTDLKFAQTELTNTFQNLKNKVAEILQQTEWLDDHSRVSMVMKLNKMDVVDLNSIGIWNNYTFIDQRMSNLLKFDGDYQQFSIALLKRYREQLYGLWGEYSLLPQHVWFFFASSFDLKPISIYALNTLVIPPGFIMSSSKTIPRYITLATLGYTIARELAAQFDTTGVTYGMKLSDEANVSYKSMETCGTDKYSLAFSQIVDGKIFSFKMNATLSINERIAEDMALKLVADLCNGVINDPLLPWLSDTYSREKIFYLAIAQEHCVKSTWEDYMIQLFESDKLPSSFLLKELFSNLISFEETFECPAGSGMNHPMKCAALPDLPKETDYYADNDRELK